MKDATAGSDWLTSGEVQKELRITSCDVMHLRVDGQLAFKKHGNAFMYDRRDVERLKKQHHKPVRK